MKIKMKVGMAGPAISLAPGDTPDYEDEAEARRLIDAGFAEPVTDEAALSTTPAQPASTPPRARASKSSVSRATGAAGV